MFPDFFFFDKQLNRPFTGTEQGRRLMLTLNYNYNYNYNFDYNEIIKRFLNYASRRL